MPRLLEARWVRDFVLWHRPAFPEHLPPRPVQPWRLLVMGFGAHLIFMATDRGPPARSVRRAAVRRES